MSNVNQTYREVSRKANAGERIKIVVAAYADEPAVYANGDVVMVVKREYDGAIRIDRKWNDGSSHALVFDHEYVVLEPIAPAAPNLPDLFAQFIRDNAGAVRSYLAELDPVDSAEPVTEVSEVTPQPAPPTLTRAKVIEMARERVAELSRIGRDIRVKLPAGKFHDEFYGLKFRVNRERRTVVAEVMSRDGSYRKAKAYAKCAPDDVFNADIGKAIAAERALGLTVTDAFVNAPKPTEPTKGMSVIYEGRVRKLVPSNTTVIHGETAHVLSYVGQYGTIIDDTDADYTEEAGEAA